MKRATVELDSGVHDGPMTPREAAAYLRLNPRTFDEKVRTDGVPVHRIGSGPKAQRRFYRVELDTWLRSKCSDSTADESVA